MRLRGSEVIFGGLFTPPSNTTRSRVCSAVPPRPSLTRRVTGNVPKALGSQLSRPVKRSIFMPGGAPGARLYVSGSPSGSLATTGYWNGTPDTAGLGNEGPIVGVWLV